MRLTNKKEADAQRKAYERRRELGYPRNITEERFLKLAAYEDAGLEPEQIAEYLNATDEYVRASEEGRLIVLPCKVGDTVYLLERFCDGSKGDCDSWVSCEECDDYKQQIYPRRIVSIDAAFAVIGMLGKTVFLTREEAEAALKKMVTDSNQLQEE